MGWLKYPCNHVQHKDQQPQIDQYGYVNLGPPLQKRRRFIVNSIGLEKFHHGLKARNTISGIFTIKTVL